MNADAAFAWFRGGVESNRMAHAYVVAGDPRTFGREFVERCLCLLHCAAPAPPCGVCVACRQVRERTHPDVFWVEPAKKSRTLSIEQVREDILPQVAQTSFLGGWKSVVLLAADRMSAAAANALLKTLEEPPGHTVFFLLTDQPRFLLPTILSRCQRITLSGEAEGLPQEWQDALGAAMAMASRQGVGASPPLNAMAAAGQIAALFREVRKAAEDQVRSELADEEVGSDKDTVNARVGARFLELRMALLRWILAWQHDLLRLACGHAEGLASAPKWHTILYQQAAGLTLDGALRRVAAVEEMNRRLDRAPGEGAAAAILDVGFADLVRA